MLSMQEGGRKRHKWSFLVRSSENDKDDNKTEERREQGEGIDR